MCAYCEKKEAGDTFGQEIIFFEKIPRDRDEELVVSLQIDPDNKEMVLDACTTDLRLDKEFAKHINYCPFCGQEL